MREKREEKNPLRLKWYVFWVLIALYGLFGTLCIAADVEGDVGVAVLVAFGIISLCLVVGR